MSEKAVITHDEKENEGPPSARALPDLARTDSHLDNDHVRLGWRSWMVVFVTSFAIMAQVFVVTAAGSVIAFIIRDLGDPGISGWIIQVRQHDLERSEYLCSCRRVRCLCKACCLPSLAGSRMC